LTDLGVATTRDRVFVLGRLHASPLGMLSQRGCQLEVCRTVHGAICHRCWKKSSPPTTQHAFALSLSQSESRIARPSGDVLATEITSTNNILVRCETVTGFAEVGRTVSSIHTASTQPPSLPADPNPKPDPNPDPNPNLNPIPDRFTLHLACLESADMRATFAHSHPS